METVYLCIVNHHSTTLCNHCVLHIVVVLVLPHVNKEINCEKHTYDVVQQNQNVFGLQP